MVGLSKNDVSGWGKTWEGFGKSWDKFWDDMNPSGKSTVGKAGVFAKWAGYAMTVANDFIENKEEFNDDLGNARLWGETLIEGTTDVVLAAGASILVAAALPASAPAIVVGAVGAGVVWLGNEVCEYFTGQDIAECVSDAVYGAVEVIGDIASDIGNAVEDAAENIGNAVRETGRNIANAVDSACEWIGGLFG